MCNPRAFVLLQFLLLASSLSAKSNVSSQWKTLTGSSPLVIAHGGFSGLLPDSSAAAYALALQTSVADVALWCDVQLTKDAVGICVPDPNLDRYSFISDVFRNQSRSYLVNAVETTGYFSVDYTFKDLSDVRLKQRVQSRSPVFDDSYPILTVDDVTKQMRRTKTAALWLNIQYDAFFRQHKLNMKSFVLSVSKKVRVSYISSPEIGFLKSIKPLVNAKRTKLVFQFLNKNGTDPSTNQTYDSLLKKLTFIKTFASGILVPKGYIWPVEAGYLLPHTSLVSDAHKAGLEVYASGFSNDDSLSFNYSYDPLAEYLQFIDNGIFSVDGVLSDSPVTPSAAIGCFSQLDTNATKKDNTLIISKFGASGDFPACTDVAYKKAISDGVDVLDCPIQMSKDGTPFCLNSIDLLESTTIAKTNFTGYTISIPEIKSGNGIFAFNLTWTDIKSLTPSILNPSAGFEMFRNPKYMNTGTFVTLSDFLSMTKNESTLSGILITVENAAYLAEKQGLSVTDAIIDALRSAGYDKPGSQKVYIQSTDSAVLLKFKQKTNYELVYKIDKIVYDASNEAIEDIKSLADAVVIDKKSVFPWDHGFLTSNTTRIVPKLQASNLSVFVETFSNEFVSQAWDFMSDSTVDINSFIQDAGIDGIVTDFPKTAARYRKNRCLNLGEKTPPYMLPVQVGSLYGLIGQQPLAPAPAPAPLPLLTESEVVEPPLPDVAKGASAPSRSPVREKPKNAQTKVTACFLSNVAVSVASFLLL